MKPIKSKKTINEDVSKMRMCPRCDSLKLLTQTSKRVYVAICDECGREEKLIDSGKMKANKIENDFLAKYGLKINPTAREIGVFIQRKRFERFHFILQNANKNRKEGLYMKKNKLMKKIRAMLTFNGEFIFPYLTDKDCPNVKHVAETVKIFPNYKITELQCYSGLDENDFMRALNWLCQYGFVDSTQVYLSKFIADECSEMDC
jgi:hypothetical protein